MKLTFLIITLLVSSICISQNRLIAGEIINKENNETLPFVNIGIANKAVGTVSDIDGIFNLDLTAKITEKDTVIFSYVGFKTEKKAVAELRKKLNRIILTPETTTLDEVVVSTKKIKYRTKKLGRASKGLGLTHMN